MRRLALARAIMCTFFCAACSSGSSGGSSPLLTGPSHGGSDGGSSGGSSGGNDSGTAATHDGSADSAPPSDAGTQADTMSVPDEAGPIVCNTVVAGGPVVSPMFVAGSRPAATGGNIADGTYWLTESDVYEANWEGSLDAALPGIPVARTLVISGMTLQEAEVTSADAGPAGSTNSTLFISTSGTILSETPSCPFAAGAANVTAYSVVGSDLWLFSSLYGREVYTHQP